MYCVVEGAEVHASTVRLYVATAATAMQTEFPQW
jgi:hypothetical protein